MSALVPRCDEGLVANLKGREVGSKETKVSESPSPGVRGVFWRLRPDFLTKGAGKFSTGLGYQNPGKRKIFTGGVQIQPYGKLTKKNSKTRRGTIKSGVKEPVGRAMRKNSRGWRNREAWVRDN